MRYFITGSTGFIGSRLVQTLVDRNEDITVLLQSTSPKPYTWSNQVKPSYISLFDSSSIEEELLQQDTVIHLAYGNKGSLEERYRTTVEGTESMLNAALRAGIKRFIYVSTVSVYGEPPQDMLYTEQSPRYASLNPYVAAKQQAELSALAAAKEGLNVIILQPAIVYGPGSGYWSTGIINMLKQATFPLVNGGEGLCNAIYVDDVVEGILKAVDSTSTSGECFILSSNSPVPWQTFFESYQKIIDSKVLLKINAKRLETIYELPKPFNLIMRLFPIFLGKKPLTYLDYERIKFFASKPTFSNQKARNILHFSPSYDLESGMNNIRRWILESR